MRPGLHPGLRARFARRITADECVPALFADAAPLRAMPEVLATAYMVGLMEWACVEQLAPFLEPGEGSLGTHVDVSHVAATPPGLTVTVTTEILSVEGRSVWFRVTAHDGADEIGAGRHRRAVVGWDRFEARVAAKAAAAAGGA